MAVQFFDQPADSPRTDEKRLIELKKMEVQHLVTVDPNFGRYVYRDGDFELELNRPKMQRYRFGDDTGYDRVDDDDYNDWG